MSTNETTFGGRRLLAFIRSAQERQLCCQIQCSTCGGAPFLKGAVSCIRHEYKPTRPISISADAARALASVLSEIEPNDSEKAQLERYVRFLIFEIARSIGESNLQEIAGSAWLGTVLTSMQLHHRNLYNLAAARERDVVEQRARRESNKQLRLEVRRKLKEQRNEIYHQID